MSNHKSSCGRPRQTGSVPSRICTSVFRLPQMDDISNCYRILDLEPGASLEQVKRSYRELVKVWHPDRFCGDPQLQQKAEEKLKAVNLAYERIAKSERATRGSDAKTSDSSRSEDKQKSRPTGPQGGEAGQDVESSNITAWALSAAAAFASWKVLPYFCVRTVETGFWPFKSSHHEILWGLVLALSIAIGVGTYLIVRRRPGTKR